MLKFSSIDSSTKGFLAAFVALLSWGVFALYWKELSKVSPFEVLSHRLIWSFITLFLVVMFMGKLKEAYQLCLNKKCLLLLCVSSFLIAGNWLVYITAVVGDKVIEASLGYYINPLVSIVLGRLFFKENPTRLAWIGISIAALGVANEVIAMGKFPYISFPLAISFALYSSVRKFINIDAILGLFIETLIMLPFSLGYLVWLYFKGNLYFSSMDFDINMLLIFSGPITTLPLILFTYGVKYVRMTTLGIMQYIPPSITFLLGIFVFNEKMQPSLFLTFACVWTGLIIYTYSLFLLSKKASKV